MGCTDIGTPGPANSGLRPLPLVDIYSLLPRCLSSHHPRSCLSLGMVLVLVTMLCEISFSYFTPKPTYSEIFSVAFGGSVAPAFLDHCWRLCSGVENGCHLPFSPAHSVPIAITGPGILALARY